MRRERQRETERGAIAVLAAIVLIAIGGFLALSLNVGHKMNAKAQLQSAMDAAALGGAGDLDGTSTAVTNAHPDAQDFATKHYLDTAAVAVNANLSNSAGGDIEVGYWDVRTNRFYREGDSPFIGDFNVTLSHTATPQFLNAVRVSGGADGVSGHNSPLDVFLSSFVGGVSTLNVKASAVAMAGGPCVASRNVVPIEVASCALTNASGDTLCNQDVTLTLDGPGVTMWNIAFADLTPPANLVDDAEVGAQFVAAWTGASVPIDAFPTPGDIDSAITSTAGTLTTQGLTVGTGPGNMPAAAIDTGAFGTTPRAGATRVRMPVVNTGSNTAPCTATMHVPTVTPIGFVTVVFRNVNLAPGPGLPRTMRVWIDCNQSAVDNSPLALGRAGCANFGYPALRYAPLTFTKRVTSLVQ
jgi:Flp pilus assembly protein TadG